MFDYDFLKSIEDQIKIYKDFPLPAVICDAQWRPYWGNDLARNYYSHLTEPDGIRRLIGEFDLQRLREDLLRTGNCTIQDILPFSDVGASLSPILDKGELVGILFLFLKADSLIAAKDVYLSTKTLGALSDSIRDAVAGIFSALDTVSLKSDLLDMGWIKSGFDKVAYNNYRILRISGNITEYARHLSGLMELDFHPVDLTALLGDLRGTLSELAASARVPVRFSLPEEAVVVELDTGQFESALFNVLHNALYFTADGNEISLELRKQGGYAVLCVHDKGLGIPKQILADVFRPYFAYAHGGTGRGVGLGLTVARLAVEAHGGSVGIQSRHPGGTCVTIRLPELKTPRTVQLEQAVDRYGPMDRFSPIYVGLADALAARPGDLD